jgi:hypothetical protein
MLLLESVVDMAVIEIGHLLIPISTFQYDKRVLERMFISAVKKYQEYRPIEKQEVFTLDDAGVYAPKILQVAHIKPYYQVGFEYNERMPVESWDFRDGVLSAVFAGDYIVRYIANYDLANHLYREDVTQTFADETEISFRLRGEFKKGTLNIKAKELTNTYEMTEDLASYNNLISAFTVDIPSDKLTITELVGSRLTTGDEVTLTTDGTLPSPLTTGTKYYVRKVSDTEVRLVEEPENADIPNVTFTTDFATNPTQISVPDHDLVNNQPVILATTRELPAPLLEDNVYYVIKIDNDTIELESSIGGGAINLTDDGRGVHEIEFGFIDITDIGVGNHNLVFPNDLNQVLITGTLGDGYIDLDTLDVFINLGVNTNSTVEVSFNTKYKSCVEIEEEDPVFIKLFTAMLMMSLGNNKSIAKLDGLPFDVTLDDLNQKGKELMREVQEELNNRGKWWLFA